MKNSKFKEAYLEIINQSWTGAAGGALAGAALGGPVGAIGGALVGSQLGNQQGQENVNAIEPAVPVEGQSDQTAVKAVTFKTADEGLLDALNNGFEEVVFFVKSTDENGNETVEEVKFGADAFGPFEVVDAVEETETEGDVESECGESDGGDSAALEESDQLTEDEEAPAEEGDVETECGDSTNDTTLEESNQLTEDEEADAEKEDEVTTEEDEAPVEGSDGDNSSPEISEEIEEEEEDSEIDPSEWLEDGVCVKCGAEDCDGTCKCKKCGSINCIGDCE